MIRVTPHRHRADPLRVLRVLNRVTSLSLDRPSCQAFADLQSAKESSSRLLVSGQPSMMGTDRKDT